MKKNSQFLLLAINLFLLFGAMNLLPMFWVYTDNENKLSAEFEDENYIKDLQVILAKLKIKDGNESIKPQGFRPLIYQDDLTELLTSWDIEVLSLSTDSNTITYNSLILPSQLITHVVTMRKKILINNIEKKKVESDAKIIISYRRNQKEAFSEIFQKIINVSLPLEFEIENYHVSEDLKLGELCLFEYLFVNRQNTNIKNKIYFVKDATQFSIISPTEEMISIAQYIDKRYTDLTKELNSSPTFRKWFTPDKIFSVEAKYISSDSTKVKLICKDDNKQIEIKLSKLSPVDQLYIKRRVEVEDAKSKNATPKNKVDKTVTE